MKLLLLAFVLLAQDAPPGADAAGGPGAADAQAAAPGTFLLDGEGSEDARIRARARRQSLNRLDLVVNDQCLTRMDVMRDAFMGAPSGASPDELRERMAEVMNLRVQSLLKTQAGKDLGFEPSMVQQLVRDELERKEERMGGAAGMGDRVANSLLDSGSFYESTESDILQELWARSVDGRFPGPGGRPYVDRYVRPGRLKFEYERNKGRLTLPATVTLQELAIDAQRIGDLGEARAYAEELLNRILAGEDFGEVAVQAGAADRDTKGVLQPLEETRLQGIPFVDEFIATAEVGDVSDVLPIRLDGVLRGFRVLKLLAYERPEPPPFEDRDFQSDLTRNIQEAMDRGRAEAALARLFDAAYVWPPEAFGRGEQPEPQGPPAPPSGPPPGPRASPETSPAGDPRAPGPR